MHLSLAAHLLIVAAALVHPANAYAHISAADYAHRQRVKMAHGLVMGIAFAVLLPLAAALIRMGKYKGKVWVHAGVQMSAIVLAITGLGLGVWLARKYNILLDPSGHMIIGIVVVSSLSFMPLLGWMHHLHWVKKSRRSPWSYTHIWIGRVMIVLGVINGGLGLRIKYSIRGHWETAYIILAAVFYSLWLSVAAWDAMKKPRANRVVSIERRASNESLPEENIEHIIIGAEKKSWAS